MKQSIYKQWLGRMVGLLVLALIPITAAAVDINRAGVNEIADELIQVGPSKAQAIVDYRKKHGAFRTPDDLQKVPGIGARTLEMNRGRIKVKSADAPTRPNQGRAQPQANEMPSSKGKDAGGH